MCINSHNDKEQNKGSLNSSEQLEYKHLLYMFVFITAFIGKVMCTRFMAGKDEIKSPLSAWK